MTKFEAVLLFSPDISTLLITKEEENFSSIIEKAEGQIINIEDWGLRDLSFNIDNYKKSFYKFYQLEIDGKNIQEIKRILTQNEKILRHLFVKVEEHQAIPTKMGINEEK